MQPIYSTVYVLWISHHGPGLDGVFKNRPTFILDEFKTLLAIAQAGFLELWAKCESQEQVQPFIVQFMYCEYHIMGQDWMDRSRIGQHFLPG